APDRRGTGACGAGYSGLIFLVLVVVLVIDLCSFPGERKGSITTTTTRTRKGSMVSGCPTPSRHRHWSCRLLRHRPFHSSQRNRGENVERRCGDILGAGH